MKKILEKKDTEKNKAKLEKYILKLNQTEEKVKKIKIKRIENLENPYKIKMHRNDNTKWLIIIIIICAFMGLLTPQDTFEPYTHIVKLMKGTTTQNINEHLPLTLVENTPILCTLVIVLAIMIFTKSKLKLADLFMITGLCYLMFLSRRQSSMFILIGTITLNRMIIQMLEIYGICKIKDLIKVVNIFTIILISVIILSVSKHFLKLKDKRSYINESTYPVKASEWIIENLDINNIKLYNEYNYGSYLLYKGIPVFIDSRADLYSPEFNEGCNVFMDFINTSGIGTYYGETFEKYGITHVILYKNSKMNMLIKKTDLDKYNLLYSDDNFVIYEIINY